MMNAKYMSPTMRFLFKTHSTYVCTRDGLRVRSARTHAFCAFKRALIKVYHRNMSVKSIAKSKASIAC